MGLSEKKILIVDDDEAVRDSLRALLMSAGFNVGDFASAQSLLEAGEVAGDCLITDIRMPDMDGLALQEELNRRGSRWPVIVVTGHGDVPLAVRAMKAGAVDFIEKPYEENVLLDAVRRALLLPPRGQHVQMADSESLMRFDALTVREREVLTHVIAGRPNKLIAHELGISPRTVEIHRAHLIEKMGVKSLPELVRLALAAGIDPAPAS
ncbi:MAG: response regulator transcription factor [Parvibaculaceae bacterium]